MVKLLTACVTGKLQKGWQALVWNDTEKNNSPGKMLWLDLNQKKKSVLAFNKPYQSSCITNTSTCFKRDAPQLTVWWQVCVWKTRQITEEHCSFHLKDSRRIQMITHTFSHSANIICCSCNVTTPLTLSFNNLLGQHQQQLWMAKWILMTCVCMQLREGWKKKKITSQSDPTGQCFPDTPAGCFDTFYPWWERETEKETDPTIGGKKMCFPEVSSCWKHQELWTLVRLLLQSRPSGTLKYTPQSAKPL